MAGSALEPVSPSVRVVLLDRLAAQATAEEVARPVAEEQQLPPAAVVARLDPVTRGQAQEERESALQIRLTPQAAGSTF